MVWDDLDRFESMMNRMFKDFISGRRWRTPLIEGGRGGKYLESKREPFMDVMETEKELIPTAEMPGVNKNDININITENYGLFAISCGKMGLRYPFLMMKSWKFR